VGSIANILLQVTGDSSEARRELADVARDLALFSREEAEAEVYVDTGDAIAELDELKAKLAAFDAKEVSAEVNLKIAKAQADLAVLQAELKEIDGENVTVDVDVKRGIVEKLGSLSKQIAQIGEDTEQAAQGGISAFISSIGEAWKGASIFGVSLTSIAVAAPFVIAAVVAIVGQLVAVVASAASAAGGVGALAVAFTSVLIPGIALAVGAIANFKEDAETAGTAAHALKANLGDVAEAFKNATAGGSNALFRGLSDGLKEIEPLVEHLGPAFTRLGEAGGDAIRLLADQFSSPAWQKFFTFTIDSLARLTPLFAESFGSFSKILANIATAAMPFLIAAFKDLADGLDVVAGKTSDIGGLRDVIGGMVHSLSAFGDLLGGLTDLTAAFVEAFAPFGDGIVESLAEGAHNLAEWLRSSEGLEEVKQFFETTGPLASELAKLVLNVALALIQIGEIAAPPLTAVVRILNSIFEAANKALDYVTDHAPEVGRVLAAVVAPITLLKDAFGPIKGAAETAFNAIKDLAADAARILAVPLDFALAAPRDVLGVIRDIWRAGKDIVSDVISFVLHAPRDVLGAIRDIWRVAKGIVNDAVSFVLHAPRDVLGVVRDIWRDAKGVISDAIEFVLRVPHDAAGAARALWGDVKGIISDGIDFVLGFASGIIDKARSIWDAVNDALPDITLDIHIPTPSVPHIDVPGLASGIRDLPIGGLHRVGEEGEELAFVPTGADMYNADETRRILRALAGGASRPASPAGAAAGAIPSRSGGGDNYYDLKVISPGTGSPDPDIALAKLNASLRARGGLPG
jgi:phage-related protein